MFSRIQIAATLLLAVVPTAYAQTVYVAGDSTMASGGGGSGSDGMLHTPSMGGPLVDNLLLQVGVNTWVNTSVSLS